MKKYFKIMFFILYFGWFPFMWLSAWGSWNREVGMIVLGAGAAICILAFLAFIPFVNDTDFWRSLNSLKNERERLKIEIDRTIAVRDKLMREILKHKEKE